MPFATSANTLGIGQQVASYMSALVYPGTSTVVYTLAQLEAIKDVNLEQSTALMPLPRELIFFATIAKRASDNHIGNVVSGDVSSYYARNGESMVSFINVFPFTVFFHLFKFFGTVVALVFLSYQLFLKLLRGMVTRNRPFARSAIMGIHSIQFAPMFLYFRSFVSFLKICISTLKGFSAVHLIIMFFAVSLFILTNMFLVVGIVFSTDAFCLFLVTLIILMHTLLFSCFYRFIFRCIVAISKPVLTWFATGNKSIFERSINLEKIRSFREPFQAIRTLFFMESNFILFVYAKCCAIASTFFALRCKPVFMKTMFIEISGGSRKKVKAFGTLFLRGIRGYTIHDKGQLLVRPGSVASTAQASSYFPHYSINPLYKQVKEVF